jgi:tRNA (mo5U34)-methyltransferase
MFDRQFLAGSFQGTPLQVVGPRLVEATEDVLQHRRHGFVDRWTELIDSLPNIVPGHIDFTGPVVRVGFPGDITNAERARLQGLLMELHPWRKGPFEIFGVTIDSEWRSDLKWQRLADQIRPLRGRLVLDVGCGNGYFLCRMLGQGAEYVLGVEPAQQFIAQFNVLKKFIPGMHGQILPLKFEEFPVNDCVAGGIEFDTVFSMGILYHRREPHQHIRELYEVLGNRGELVVETLIIEGGPGDVLVPAGKYAKMSNVWSIPSESELHLWLRECGFREIHTIDISATTPLEQRSTEWMTFESLADFLDPENSDLTIEGHPAPLRILVSCCK